MKWKVKDSTGNTLAEFKEYGDAVVYCHQKGISVKNITEAEK